jgi:hypothetical protein
MLVYQEYLYNKKVNNFEEEEKQVHFENTKPVLIVYSILDMKNMKFNGLQSSEIVEYTKPNSDSVISTHIEAPQLPMYKYHGPVPFYQALRKILAALEPEKDYVSSFEDNTMKLLNIFKLRVFIRSRIPHGETEILVDSILRITQDILRRSWRNDKVNISLMNLLLDLIYFSTPSFVSNKKEKIFDTLLMLKRCGSSTPLNLFNAVKGVYLLLCSVLCKKGERDNLMRFLREASEGGRNVHFRLLARSLLDVV